MKYNLKYLFFSLLSIVFCKSEPLLETRPVIYHYFPDVEVQYYSFEEDGISRELLIEDKSYGKVNLAERKIWSDLSALIPSDFKLDSTNNSTLLILKDKEKSVLTFQKLVDNIDDSFDFF